MLKKGNSLLIKVRTYFVLIANIIKSIMELKTKGNSEIMTQHIKKYLFCMVANIYKYKEWHLVFNIASDGVSYGTLYKKAADYNPSIVLIEDTKRNVFGIYASQSWKKSKDFYGTGETYVFTFKVN